MPKILIVTLTSAIHRDVSFARALTLLACYDGRVDSYVTWFCVSVLYLYCDVLCSVFVIFVHEVNFMVKHKLSVL